MPIYEYECPACGVVEFMQGINDDPLIRCPKCHRRKVKKLISESSFQLKGTGWYVTDYGRGNGNGNGKGKKKEEPKEETSASPVGSKSDHKKSDTTAKSAS